MNARALASMLALVATLSGCAAAPGLYTELGAGWKVNHSAVLDPACHTATDVTADAPRSCGGDNPTAHFALGHEFRRPWRVEWRHWSHYFDGGTDRETYKDEIIVVRRWGGRDAERRRAR